MEQEQWLEEFDKYFKNNIASPSGPMVENYRIYQAILPAIRHQKELSYREGVEKAIEAIPDVSISPTNRPEIIASVETRLTGLKQFIRTSLLNK